MPPSSEGVAPVGYASCMTVNRSYAIVATRRRASYCCYPQMLTLGNFVNSAYAL